MLLSLLYSCYFLEACENSSVTDCALKAHLVWMRVIPFELLLGQIINPKIKHSILPYFSSHLKKRIDMQSFQLIFLLTFQIVTLTINSF